MGVLPQRSLPLYCVTHDVFRCVDHPLVEMKDFTTLAFDKLMQAANAHMAEEHAQWLCLRPALGGR